MSSLMNGIPGELMAKRTMDASSAIQLFRSSLDLKSGGSSLLVTLLPGADGEPVISSGNEKAPDLSERYLLCQQVLLVEINHFD